MVPGHVTNRQTKMKRKKNALHVFVGFFLCFFFFDNTNMQEKNHVTQPLTSIPKIHGQCTKEFAMA